MLCSWPKKSAGYLSILKWHDKSKIINNHTTPLRLNLNHLLRGVVCLLILEVEALAETVMFKMKTRLILLLSILSLFCSFAGAQDQELDPLEDALSYYQDTNAPETLEPMKIHVIKLKDGLATLIESPSGFVTLINGGDNDGWLDVEGYLKENNIKKIDMIVASRFYNSSLLCLQNLISKGYVPSIVAYNPGINKDSSFLAFARQRADKVLPLKAGKTYRLGGRAKLKCIYVDGKLKKGDFGEELAGFDREAAFVVDYRKFKLYTAGMISGTEKKYGSVWSNNIADYIAGDVGDVDVAILNNRGYEYDNPQSFLQGLQPEVVLAVRNTESSSFFPDFTKMLARAKSMGSLMINNTVPVDSKYYKYPVGLPMTGDSIVITVPKSDLYYIDDIQVYRDENAKENNQAPEIDFTATIDPVKKVIYLNPEGTRDEDGIRSLCWVVGDKKETYYTTSVGPIEVPLNGYSWGDTVNVKVKLYAFDTYGKYSEYENTTTWEPDRYEMKVYVNGTTFIPGQTLIVEVHLFDEDGNPAPNKYIRGFELFSDISSAQGWTDAEGKVRFEMRILGSSGILTHYVFLTARHQEGTENPTIASFAFAVNIIG